MLAALRGNARNDLVKLHNGNDMLIGHDEIAIVQGLNGSRYDITDPYHLLAISSQFGAAPRGKFIGENPERSLVHSYQSDFMLNCLHEQVITSSGRKFVENTSPNKSQEIST
jgi:hypothetical protein